MVGVLADDDYFDLVEWAEVEGAKDIGWRRKDLSGLDILTDFVGEGEPVVFGEF